MILVGDSVADTGEMSEVRDDEREFSDLYTIGAIDAKIRQTEDELTALYALRNRVFKEYCLTTQRSEV